MTDQDTNDLTKAVAWCSERGYRDLVIVGATGKREDHTIGNISLLAEYIKDVNVKMVTDTGILMALTESSVVSSFPGQQVSIFSIDPETEITSHGLRYPLDRKKIENWWVATLNESTGDSFSLEFNGWASYCLPEIHGIILQNDRKASRSKTARQSLSAN